MLNNRSETLNKNLAPYVERTKFLNMFRHPMLVLPYSGQPTDETPINGMINQLVEEKERAVALLGAERDYMGILMMTERPFRLDALVKYVHHMDPAAFWDAMSYVWRDSEFPSRSNMGVWEILFASRGGNPALETDEFNALPEKIVVYRGGNELGLSWTTNKETAEWFANRWGKNETVWKGTVEKRHILHMDDHESELLVRPNHVQDITDISENDI